MFCKEVTGRAAGEKIFNIIDTFTSKTSLKWPHCIAVCTDGAAAITGRKSGAVAGIKVLNPQIVATYCMLHRQALPSKAMAAELHSIFSDVTVVNHVKSRPLQSRLFAQLCKELNAGYDTLLFHIEV